MSDGIKNVSKEIEPWRLSSFIITVGVVFIIFTFRLFSFQILQAEDWLGQAEENRKNTISIPTRRGVIYDRNGIVLARNIATYNIAITPSLLPDDPGEIERIIRELAEFSSVPVTKGDLEKDFLIDCGDNLGITEMVAIGSSYSPFTPVLIECDIDLDLALVIEEKSIDWPGVSIEINPVRDYPTGELSASIVGFLGPITSQLEQA
ncbi:MAG: hypothetical protein OEY93_04305, partial [Anaerolineae bacterium]|nr:hypothetical protein [Anaerolineae bacterium]